MTNTKQTQNRATQTDNAFHALIEQWNTAQSNGLKLSTAVVYSMLNKAEAASGSKYCHMVRCDVASGRDLDIVSAVWIELAEQTKRQQDAGESVDLERPYMKRQLKKGVVVIGSADIDDDDYFEWVETKPITEMHRVARRTLDSMGHKRSQSATYTYNEKTVKDNETDSTETVYVRNRKYFDTGAGSNAYTVARGGRKDSAGGLTAYASDDTAGAEYESILQTLDLTARQAQIVHYRLQGFGYRAIGRKLNVSHNAIINAMERVQRKAEAQGLTAERNAESAERQTAERRESAEQAQTYAGAERRAEAERREAENTPEKRAERKRKAEAERRERRAQAEAERRERDITEAQRDARRRLIDKVESRRKAEAQRRRALTACDYLRDAERRRAERKAQADARRRLIDKVERRA